MALLVLFSFVFLFGTNVSYATPSPDDVTDTMDPRMRVLKVEEEQIQQLI